jgi:hypothetical protein
MKIEKRANDNKVTFIISIILLIVLLAFLVIYLNKGKDKPDLKTINCNIEDNSGESELTSSFLIKTKEGKVTSLNFEYLYVFEENELLLNYQYEDNKQSIEALNKVEGIGANIVRDEPAGLLTIKGAIDYSKITPVEDLERPYSEFVKKDLTEEQITKFLKEEGYTCE